MNLLACRLTFIVASLLATASLRAEIVVADTTLDPAFDGDGRVLLPIDIRPGHDIVERMVTDNLGGYWIVGRAETAGTLRSRHFVLAATRITRQGGVAAMAVRNDLVLNLESGAGPYYEVQSLAADAQGRLLLVVIVCTGGDVDSCSSRLLRIGADGSPDASFDADGVVSLPLASGLFAGVVARSNGETWVGGRTNTPSANQMFRFGPGGEALSPLPAAAVFAEFATLAGDRLLARAGRSGVTAEVFRLDATGAPDPAFGAGGKAVIPEVPGDCGETNVSASATRLAATDDGRALLAADLRDDSSNDPVSSFVVGLTASGTVGAARCVPHLVAAFDGLASSVTGVALRNDGRAFVALPEATSNPDRGMGLQAFRLLVDGSLADDPGFNGGQPLAVPFPRAAGSSDAGATALLLDRGAAVIAGAARNDAGHYDYAAARFTGSPRVFGSSFE